MLTIKTPAKINWALSVLRKREDGYHDIISLIHAIDVYDTLIFEEAKEIEICCSLPIKKENNLVYRAAQALQKYSGLNNGVKIQVIKEIPVGAGLAGGSSNAAATLKALNKLWNLNLSSGELKSIGETLGSDISFFFNLPICIVEGRGEIVKPLNIQRSFCLLLVKPPFSISTRWAYESLEIESELTENYQKINNNIWQLYEFLCQGTGENIHLWNDLEKVVIKKYPLIKEIKRRLLAVGAKASLMSGSGSTVFGVFNSEEEAKLALKRFSGYWVRVAHTLVSEDLNISMS